MATLTFDGTNDYIKINPLSTSLNNMPAGVGTLAAVIRRTNRTTDDDICGLRGGDISGGFYKGFRATTSVGEYNDDNGLVNIFFQSAGGGIGTTADDFMIAVLDWPGTDALERVHMSGAFGSAESWTHTNSNVTSGGTQAGPGTSAGFFLIGNYDGGWFLGDIALIGFWSVRFSDADALDLWVNKQTSDWWNHSAGQPKTLIELNTSTPTDIGSDPVSTITLSGPALTGLNPTGWTFDGRGAAPSTEPFRLYPMRSRHTSW